MSATEARAFRGDGDVALLVAFATQAMASRRPRSTYWHAGDIVWQVSPLDAKVAAENIHLWFDGEGLAGFVLFEPPLNYEFDVRADIALDTPLAGEILAWAEDRRLRLLAAGDGSVAQAYAMLGEGTVATTALDSDTDRIAMLKRRGYVVNDRHSVCYARSLETPIPASALPAGMRARHATDADAEQRMDLHRDAWSVWGPSSATVEAYRRLRAAPVYDEELDIVVEAEDGKLVSYCIAWVDAENGVGTYEPVGTRPAYAGRGLAREAIYEGFRRLAARGVHTALVSTASINAPALRLYPSCGFEIVDRRRYYVKQIARGITSHLRTPPVLDLEVSGAPGAADMLPP